jgi:phenylacetaldehyde dehydrogenase
MVTENVSKRVGKFLAREAAMLINNEWKTSTGERIPVINPATEETISQLADATANDVASAVGAARSAFDDGKWGRLSASDREGLLLKLADLIDKNAEELSEIEYLDNGKPRRFFLAGDVPGAARTFRYFAGWATKIYGETSESSYGTNYHVYTKKEPVGVVGLITPWNVPLAMAAWKLAPALAAGCSCVLKPSEETSLSALRLGELIVEAGFPPGAVNIVTGRGSTAGATLVAHDSVDKVSFTGSTDVGRTIVRAAASNLKKVSLELGGKSPTLVFPDADLAKAIPACAMSIFMNSGQICAAGSRIYVHDKIYDQVVDGIVQFAEKIVVGEGSTDDVVMGPLISAKQLETVAGYVDLGLKEGAEVLAGGKRLFDRGYFYAPTVLGNANDTMRVAREEIFGPVLVAQKFKDTDEAVSRANDSPYGLFARVWTNNLSTAHQMAKRLKAGSVHVNGSTPPDPNVPFGGMKQSGWGREFGREGLDAYLETKSVLITT